MNGGVVIKRKIRHRIFAFVFAVGIFFSSVFSSFYRVHASGVTVAIDVLEVLLGELVGEVKDFVLEEAEKSGADRNVILSDSSFPDLSDTERIVAYVENNGVYSLGERWTELKEQYLNNDGVVDKDYYIALYQSIANNLIYETNKVAIKQFSEIFGDTFYYTVLEEKLGSNDYSAFLQRMSGSNFYIVVDKYSRSKSKNSSVYTDTYVDTNCYLAYDLFFGLSNSFVDCSTCSLSYGSQSLGVLSSYGNSCYIRYAPKYDLYSYYSLTAPFGNYMYDTEQTVFTSLEKDTLVPLVDQYEDKYSLNMLPIFTSALASHYDSSCYTKYSYSYYVIKKIGLTPGGIKNLNSDATLLTDLRKHLNDYKSYINENDNDIVDENTDKTYKVEPFVDDKMPKFLIDDTDFISVQTEDDVNNLDVTIVSVDGSDEDSDEDSDVDNNEDSDGINIEFPWLSFLFDWFQKIIDAILSLVGGIVDGILNGLGNVLQGLFVPSDDFFTSNFSSVKDKLANKFGFSDYKLFFDALKNCAKGAWNFEFTFHIAEKEYTLAIANVDEWFKETNLSKIHFLMRGFFYPLVILANVNYMTWFLRGSYLISPTKSSDG